MVTELFFGLWALAGALRWAKAMYDDGIIFPILDFVMLPIAMVAGPFAWIG